MKEYKKAEVVAKNASSGSYVAGCPPENAWGAGWCKNCERTA